MSLWGTHRVLCKVHCGPGALEGASMTLVFALVPIVWLHIFITPHFLTPFLLWIPVLDTLIFLLFLHYLILCMTSDPGIIPRSFTSTWAAPRPHDGVEDTTDDPEVPLHPPVFIVNVAGDEMKLRFCPTCQIIRPPRSTHCSICDVCVERFDHHCGFIGNCVGKRNLPYFTGFIGSAALGLVIFALTFTLRLIIVTIAFGHAGLTHPIFLTEAWPAIAGLVYCAMFAFSLTNFFVVHLHQVWTDRTTKVSVFLVYHHNRSESKA